MTVTALVVDRSAVMRSVVIRTLRRSGIPFASVFQASSTDDALQLLERESVDVLLVDVGSPAMEGDALFEHVRADARLDALVVVLLSGDEGTERLAALHARGAEILRTPFTPEDVRSVMVRALRGAKV